MNKTKVKTNFLNADSHVHKKCLTVKCYVCIYTVHTYTCVKGGHQQGSASENKLQLLPCTLQSQSMLVVSPCRLHLHLGIRGLYQALCVRRTYCLIEQTGQVWLCKACWQGKLGQAKADYNKIRTFCSSRQAINYNLINVNMVAS